MKQPLEMLLELQRLDNNTLSCLRGDMEKILRSEVSSVRSSEVVDKEVHSRYLKGLETLLDFVCSLEGYDRTVPGLQFEELVLAVMPAPTEPSEETTKRWVTA